VRLDDLGNPNAVPVAKDVYDRLRERNLSETAAAGGRGRQSRA